MERCLDVGVRLCSSESDSFVDDIPAVSATLIKNLNDADLKTFSTFFEELKDSAYTHFKKDMEMEFTKEKNFKHIIAETKPFSVSKEKTLFSDTFLIGYIQYLPFHQFVEYHVNSLGIFAHQAGDIEVHIIDLVTNETLSLETKTLVKGRNIVKIGHVVTNDFQSDIFVGIKVIDAVLVSMSCEELTDCGCDYTCDYDFSYGRLDSPFTITSLIKQYSKYFCLDASVKCSFEKMICSYPEYFQEAYKHQVAIHILNDKLNSYRRGWYSDANTQTVREFTLPELKERYMLLMELSVTNLRELTNDSICWECSVNNSKPLKVSYV